MLQKILIANRGEIACRIARTARRLGVSSVAVYSDADAQALHARSADEAIWIGPSPATASYLNFERIIAAALATGADAIHPGYGFLSENSAFAQACAEAGIIFIGPSVEAIRIMGSKREAKILMAKYEVPLVPGYYGETQDPAFLQERANEIGYPVLIKASAGGGGRGMRVVESAKEFASALASAQRESKSAFADATVLLEKYIEAPRHIEVQVFGDRHGNVVHLFERDCSLQRRHQKVIEEAPAIGLSDQQRDTLFRSAIAAARAVQYEGAGTVEFVVDKSDAIYFIEMNTRLQVEHPVTEMITGLDLVEWQLRVAGGEPLPLHQSEIKQHGYAIETRVYAEDPSRDFRPSTGTVTHLQFPATDAHTRIDTGIVAGDAVSPFYDAMVAKLITHAADRAGALQRMLRVLSETEIVGVTSNIAYLRRIIGHQAFQAGQFSTHFAEEHRQSLLETASEIAGETWCVAVTYLVATMRQQAELVRTRSRDFTSPWFDTGAFRVNAAHRTLFTFTGAEGPVHVHATSESHGLKIETPARTHHVTRYQLREHRLELLIDDRLVHASVVAHGAELNVFLHGAHFKLIRSDPLHAAEEDEEAAGSLVAPMPGTITAVLVKLGDAVTRGTPLLVLEAMKIEHTISAPLDGIVTEIRVSSGEQVTAEGMELVKLVASALVTADLPGDA